MSSKKKWGIALAISASLLVICTIGARAVASSNNGNRSDLGDVFVVGFIITGGLTLFIGFFYLMEAGADSVQKSKEELNSMSSLDYNGTLHLNGRGSILQKRIDIVADRNIITAYNPEQLHIGAVSVGGVVSGGTYKTGGNYYVAHSEKSGKYILVYGDDKKTRQTIKRIKLSGQLYNQALNSPIKKYLDKNEKQIVLITDQTPYLSSYERMWKAANLQAGNIGLTEAEKAGYPSYEKCKAIYDWICSSSFDSQPSISNSSSNKVQPSKPEKAQNSKNNGKFKCKNCNARTSIYYESCPYCNSKDSLELIKL